MSDKLSNNSELPTLQVLAINATKEFVVAPSSTLGFQEDIVMSDDDDKDLSTFSANQHSQPSQAFDLNTFSAMMEANDESDSELTNGFAEAITSKKHDLSLPDCARLKADLALNQPAAPIFTDPTATLATAVRVDSKKLTLNSGTPHFGDIKNGKGQSFQVLSDPHLFLDVFNTVARIAETGRRPKESYRNFAMRLLRSV
ncbi:hypothetical protein BGZ95_006895, partial [Linnemannia exigua]